MAKHKYTMEDWRAVRKGLDAGGTIRGVAAETGVDRGAVFRWSRRDRPPDWMWLEIEPSTSGCARARGWARVAGAPSYPAALQPASRPRTPGMMGRGRHMVSTSSEAGISRRILPKVEHPVIVFPHPDL